MKKIYLPIAMSSIFLVLLFYSSLALAQVSEQDIIKNSLFDIQLAIPNDFKIINPGEELLASVKLVNLGSAGRIDVFLDYWIADSEQNIILQTKETVAVETQAGFVRTFVIPENTKSGQYSLYAKITYADGKEATANNSFEIAENQIDRRVYYALIGIIVLAILVYLAFKSKPLFQKLRVRSEVLRIVRNRRLDK